MGEVSHWCCLCLCSSFSLFVCFLFYYCLKGGGRGLERERCTCLRQSFCKPTGREMCTIYRWINAVEQKMDSSARKGARCGKETLGGGWKKTHSLKCRNQNQKRGWTYLHQVRTFKGMVIFLPRMFTRRIHWWSVLRRIWYVRSDPYEAFCTHSCELGGSEGLWNKPHHNTATMTPLEVRTDARYSIWSVLFPCLFYNLTLEGAIVTDSPPTLRKVDVWRKIQNWVAGQRQTHNIWKRIKTVHF